MFIKKIVVVFLAVMTANSYADPFSTVTEKVTEQLVAEGYTIEFIESTLKSTPAAKQLREYLKSSCLIHNNHRSYRSGSFSGGTNYREIFEMRANGTFTTVSTSNVAAGNGGASVIGKGGNDALEGYWNVYQGISGQLLLAFYGGTGLVTMLSIPTYDAGALSMVTSLGGRSLFRRYANSTC